MMRAYPTAFDFQAKMRAERLPMSNEGLLSQMLGTSGGKQMRKSSIYFFCLSLSFLLSPLPFSLSDFLFPLPLSLSLFCSLPHLFFLLLSISPPFFSYSVSFHSFSLSFALSSSPLSLALLLPPSPLFFLLSIYPLFFSLALSPFTHPLFPLLSFSVSCSLSFPFFSSWFALSPPLFLSLFCSLPRLSFFLALYFSSSFYSCSLSFNSFSLSFGLFLPLSLFLLPLFLFLFLLIDLTKHNF